MFSLSYPESVDIGEIMEIKAIIDYSVSTSTDVKWVLSDPSNTVNYTENQFTLNEEGSSNISHYLEATETGSMNFILTLYYNHNGNWIELEDSTRTFSITVNELEETDQLPGFNPLSLLVGLSLIIIAGYLKNQKY